MFVSSDTVERDQVREYARVHVPFEGHGEFYWGLRTCCNVVATGQTRQLARICDEIQSISLQYRFPDLPTNVFLRNLRQDYRDWNQSFNEEVRNRFVLNLIYLSLEDFKWIMRRVEDEIRIFVDAQQQRMIGPDFDLLLNASFFAPAA